MSNRASDISKFTLYTTVKIKLTCKITLTAKYRRSEWTAAASVHVKASITYLINLFHILLNLMLTPVASFHMASGILLAMLASSFASYWPTGTDWDISITELRQQMVTIADRMQKYVLTSSGSPMLLWHQKLTFRTLSWTSLRKAVITCVRAVDLERRRDNSQQWI